MNSRPTQAPAVWFDHFVVAIDDLDRGVSEFAVLTGIRAERGGEHPTLGTHNALVSLGEKQYLEILAPRPGALLHPMVRGVQGCSVLTPLLWALATEDLTRLHGIIATTGFEPHEISSGSRTTEAGETLRWSMFTMHGDGLANVPFFIEWEAATTHPSRSAPTGCSLEGFSVRSPDHEDVERLLATIDFNAVVTPGTSGIAIELETPRGTLTLGP